MGRSGSELATKVGPPPQLPSPPPPPPINMLGHCVFCLRKTSSDIKLGNKRLRKASSLAEDATMNLLKAVPRAVLGDGVSLISLLNCLNRVWRCILKKSGRGKGNGDDDNFESLLGDKKVLFSKLPDMCQYCAVRFISVDKAMRELEEMMDKLGGIVMESKNKGGRYSWRGEGFLKTLRSSNLEVSSIFQTLKLLGVEDDEFTYNCDDPDATNDPSQQSLSESVDLPRDPLASSPVPFCEESDEDGDKAGHDPVDVDIKSELKDDPEDFHDIDDHPMQYDFGGNSDETTGVPDYIKSEVEDEELVTLETESVMASPKKETDIESISHRIINRSSQKSGPRAKAFRSKTTRISHPGKTHPRQDFRKNTQTCDLCKRQIPLTSISKHVAGHVGKEHVRKCPNSLCNYVFIFTRSINEHVNRNKACKAAIPNVNQFLNPVHVCESCGFSTSCSKVLRGHVNRNHEMTEKTFPCPVKGCPEKFTVKQSISLHLSSHNNRVCRSSKKDRQFPCQKCDKDYGSQLGLNTHKWRKHKDSSVPVSVKEFGESFKCEECNQEFKSSSVLRGHNILVHDRDWYICKLCSEKFSTKAMLSKHTREHTGKLVEFKCDVPGCDKVFKEKLTLTNHISFVHLGDRSNSCDICGKVYANPKSLLSHTKAVHLGIRAHVCEVCGQSFTGASVLKKHRLIHTGERPFVCEICGQRFRHRNVLRTHLEGHAKKGNEFKPNGHMNGIRKRK